MLIEHTSPGYQDQVRQHFNTAGFDAAVDDDVGQALTQFKEITRNYTLFHVCFASLGVLELFAFVLFFSFLTQSTMLAFSLAGILLTGFAYFVLLFYLQAKKPEQLLNVRRSFLDKSRRLLPFEPGMREYHLCSARALESLVNQLHEQANAHSSFFSSFKTLGPLIQKFTLWAHWKDLHQMQEALLHLVIRENIALIKTAPTDLEHHASLANAYWILAQHYQDPRIANPAADPLWVSPEYASLEMQEKFKRSALRAIEEYKILDTFAPNDPWVYAQMASIYHALGLPEEEIRQYETILNIHPDEKEILFRLGVLYFSQGRNAQALRLYEQLSLAKDSKAEELLSYYDAYAHADP
jgi:tetratricopeptide (TPR) repeat protein